VRIVFYGNFGVPYSSESHHAASLEALGHEVVRLQEPQVHADVICAEAEKSDLFVWIKTHGWDTPGDMGHTLTRLREVGVPSISFHLDLYMGLQRWQQYKSDPFLMGLDHFFTVDRLMADWLNQNTPVKGHYATAAVFGPECYLGEPDHPFGNDVIFVGQKNYHPEWPYRPQLVSWLEDTYEDRFTRIAGDTPAGTTRGDDLNRLYASSKVVVGDTLCLGFDYPDYWSDRVYETLGRGGFLIHPRIKGMDQHFRDGGQLFYYDYGDFDQLGGMIDFFLNDADGQQMREEVRIAGHEDVKEHHTYAHRWEQILGTVFA
jgi:hypothetical protein